jgi:2-haloacid dehalogenase
VNGIRAFVFDVFGTVVDWRTGVARDVAPFLARLSRTDICPLAFADAWRARYAPAMEEVRSGRRAFVRLDELHRENLDVVLAGFSIDPQQVVAQEKDFLNTSWHRLDPWPDAVPGLTRLKTGYVIAPLSNGNISLLLNMAKRAGLPWDAILGAEVSQAYKPMPQSYLRTAEALGLRPEQVCMVAAHEDDLAAAMHCGFKTAFVPRPQEFGAARGRDRPAAGQWTMVAEDFLELAAIACT